MTTTKISEAADDVADSVAEQGRRASPDHRRAGDAIEDAADGGARSLRSSGRRGERAYNAASNDFDDRVESLEETIRRNPLASAGAALLIGVVLGRFIL